MFFSKKPKITDEEKALEKEKERRLARPYVGSENNKRFWRLRRAGELYHSNILYTKIGGKVYRLERTI